MPVGCEEVELSSDLGELARARELVRELCGRMPAPPDEEYVSGLELAVTEVVSNIIKHAYRGRPDQAIHLRAEVSADQISLLLRHRGEPFDPRNVRPPSFDGSRESGFGVYLIRQSVDEARYYRDELGHNCVSLVKRR